MLAASFQLYQKKSLVVSVEKRDPVWVKNNTRNIVLGEGYGGGELKPEDHGTNRTKILMEESLRREKETDGPIAVCIKQGKERTRQES